MMSEESRGNPLCGPAETENTSKIEDDEELRSELSQDVREWLEDFQENLVDTHVQLFSWITNGAASKSGTGLG